MSRIVSQYPVAGLGILAQVLPSRIPLRCRSASVQVFVMFTILWKSRPLGYRARVSVLTYHVPLCVLLMRHFLYLGSIGVQGTGICIATHVPFHSLFLWYNHVSFCILTACLRVFVLITTPTKFRSIGVQGTGICLDYHILTIHVSLCILKEVYPYFCTLTGNDYPYAVLHLPPRYVHR